MSHLLPTAKANILAGWAAGQDWIPNSLFYKGDLYHFPGGNNYFFYQCQQAKLF